MTHITSVCSSDMENVQKKRSLPMKTKINDIPIKKISKVKLTREAKNRKLNIIYRKNALKGAYGTIYPRHGLEGHRPRMLHYSF